MALDYDQLIHRVDFERYLGDSSTGAAYAAPVGLACYLETRTVQLEPGTAEELGVLSGLEGTLWANAADLTPGSRCTIRGQVGYLGAATRYDDGNALDHVEVEVTPRPPMSAQRTAAVSLVDPDSASTEWDDAAQTTVVTEADPYAIGLAARIVPASRVRASFASTVAEEQLADVDYLISVYAEVTPEIGHYVLIEECTEDPTFAGESLRIDNVIRGTQRPERVLFCSHISPG